MASVNEKVFAIDDCWNQTGIWSKGHTCPRLKEFIHCANCDVYTQTSRTLLSRALPNEQIAQWTTLLAEEQAFRIITDVSVVIFRVGDEWFSLPSKLVVEVLEMAPIHPLPHVRNSNLLKGLVNIKGQLEICISLGNLLDIPPSARDRDLKKRKVHNRLVLIDSDEHKFVFPSNEIAGVYRYNNDDLMKLPSTVSMSAVSYIKGSIEWQDITVACIDDELLLKAFTRTLA